VVTISAVYASDISRVRISCSAAPADADVVLIERSTNQINWTTVRGGQAVVLSAGACKLDDYEFSPNVVNYYRATYVDTAPPSFVAEGTVSTANNASVTPGLPAGVQDGDILVLSASIRNTAGAPNTPAGWSVIADVGNFKVFTRVYAAGVTAPTVTFAGGVANADTIGRIRAYRNASFNVLAATQSNASAQNVAFPAVAVVDIKPNMIDLSYWKQSDSTSSVNTGWTLVSRSTATAGDDATTGAWRLLTSTDAAAGTVVMGGGVAAVSKAAMLRFARKEYLARETGNVTPSITSIWLKNIQRPFLNRAVTVVGQSDVDLPGRSGVFEIVGSDAPIAVTELRGSERFTLTLRTTTRGESTDMKGVLKGGDVVLLHAPPDCDFDTAYYLIGAVRKRRGQSVRSAARYWDLTMIQCAAPNPVLVGVAITWQSVVNTYATWSDLVAAKATWAAVLDGVGTPGDVVVP
jgi:hypothetical protein